MAHHLHLPRHRVAPWVRWITAATVAYAAWVQPVGASDAYRKGDRVLFQGATYESVIDANTWSPAAYPAGWKKV